MQELTERLLEEYADTQDEALLRERLQEIENRVEESLDSRHDVVFEVCQIIKDKEGMKRAARNYFIQDFFFTDAEELLTQAGLKSTSALYQKRADYWFEHEYYTEALDMYLQARNHRRIKKLALLLEDSPYIEDRQDALKGFLTIKDEKSAHRVAEKIFIGHETTKKGIETMTQLKLEVTLDLWKTRAEYQLNECINFENALEAYNHLGDKENIKLIKRKIESCL